MNKYRDKKSHLIVLALVWLFCSINVTGQVRGISSIQNVVILGNSITRHAPDASLGWFGNWGMAASGESRDYVHDLERKFKRVDPLVRFHVKTIVDFERSYWNYDFSRLDSFKDIKPELIILHIGENVNAKMLDQKPFEPYYIRLLQYFSSDNPDVKIICTSSFWKQDRISGQIEEATKKAHGYYVKIDQLSSDSANMAIGKFKNRGVAIHPSDKGMEAMANLIWQKTRYIYRSESH